MTVEEAAAYAKYSERMRYEHELISDRLRWLLVSQGLFFAAYAAAIAKSMLLLTVMPVLGATLSLLALCSIGAAVLAKCTLWTELRKLDRFKDEPFWVNTEATKIAAGAEFFVPVAFLAAWFVLAYTSDA